MKKYSILPVRFVLLVLLMSASILTVNSQSLYDLSGDYTGEHIEYATDSTEEDITYLYRFELEQEGNKVSGKSFIYNDEGYYAVVQIKGVVVENEFFFEEFNTLDELNPALSSWCYTSGKFEISIENRQLFLRGKTKSHTKEYGIFCKNGYSEVFKVLEDESPLIGNEALEEKVTDIFFSANPTDAETILHFNLNEDAFAILKVVSLEDELVFEAYNRALKPGKYQMPIDLSFKKDGMYIVELFIDRKLHSKELWKISL